MKLKSSTQFVYGYAEIRNVSTVPGGTWVFFQGYRMDFFQHSNKIKLLHVYVNIFYPVDGVNSKVFLRTF